MIVTYESRDYSPDKVLRRYVSCASVKNQRFNFCEINDKHRDIRQGRVEASEIPEAVRKSAEAMSGQAFAYVEWPS